MTDDDDDDVCSLSTINTSLSFLIRITLLYSHRLFCLMSHFFLQSGWMEVKEKQAREKVSHFFRRRRELHTISESKNPESTTTKDTQQEKRVLPS